MATIDERLADLERLVAQQRDQLERQSEEIDGFRRAAQPTAHQQESVGSSASEQSDRTRRTFFKAGLAAAGAAVAAPLVAQPVSAADGGNMIIGGNNGSTTDTVLNAGGSGIFPGSNVLTVTDNSTSSSYPAAVGAYAEGDRVRNGLYAFAGTRDDSDTSTGHAIVARKTFGGRSHIFMPPSGGDPRNENYQHSRGELRSSSGDLWLCVSSGTPGTWRLLAGSRSSGALHVISPQRAYDSRFTDGPLTSGFSRTVAVADSIDVTTGAVTQFGTVPAGATAVQFNLTIVGTVASGFLSAAPGGATEIQASTINWSSSNSILANASMSTVNDDRELTVFCGGVGAASHFLIDITGYTQ